MTLRHIVAGLGAAAILGGCKPPVDPGVGSPPAQTPVPTFTLTRGTDAGVPLAANSNMQVWPQIIVAKTPKFTPRPDPFSLRGHEQNWENRMTAERLVMETGNFSPSIADVVEPRSTRPEDAHPWQAQPYRRLAGVLVGDSVMALIEMGDGQPAQLVRPGQRIGEWRVISIDQEKAVLRRAGNFRPHEITVRLESKPFDAPAGGAPGGQPAAPGGQPAPGRGRQRGG